MTTDYDYDAASRLDELVQNLAGTSDDRTLSFSHNPAGQITSRTDSNTGYAWTDFVNFDETTSYSGLNQMLSVTAQSTAPLYDGRGNMTRDHQGQTYEYDHYNRLSGVGTSIDLAYDPAGRLQETSGTGITFREMQYDGLDLIAEYDGSGTLTARYVHGPGADEPLVQYAGTSVSTRQWLLADERGSIVAVTDWSGAAIQINSYDEYGAPASGNAGRFGYTGQVWLPETGLYHYKNRAYHPELGRFMQTDPIGVSGGMNLYAYVGGDPVNFVDPLGLDPNDCDDGGAEHEDWTGQCRSLTQVGNTLICDRLILIPSAPSFSRGGLNGVHFDSGPGASSYSACGTAHQSNVEGIGGNLDPAVSRLIVQANVVSTPVGPGVIPWDSMGFAGVIGEALDLLIDQVIGSATSDGVLLVELFEYQRLPPQDFPSGLDSIRHAFHPYVLTSSTSIPVNRFSMSTPRHIEVGGADLVRMRFNPGVRGNINVIMTSNTVGRTGC